MNDGIYWPMIAQVALTSVVAWRMYQRRIAEIRSRRIDPQELATRQRAAAELEDVAPADNFQNLFEVPVLFFVVCLALAATGNSTQLQLVLAWIYVALRGVHSWIHVTKNRVIRRFYIFMLSNVVLLCMWVLFAYALRLD